MLEKSCSTNTNDAFDDCILYELLVYSEWKQDPELLKFSRGSDIQLFSSGSHQRSARRLLQFFSNRESICEEIQRLQLLQLPWHFAVGEGGKVVAILQDTILEIRTSRDEYSSIVGKASIAKDPNPQWRRLAWSPDCSMLAVAHSNGVVSFYDLLGSNIFNIYPPRFQEDTQYLDKKCALAFISFLHSRRKSPKWSAEFMMVDYQGLLYCYLVSPTDGFQQSHAFSFTSHYQQGILAVSYHPSHNMLFVVGPAILQNVDALKGHGSSFGLSAWRLLNDYPYYRLALSTDEEQAVLQAQRSWWNWVPLATSKPKQSFILKMQVSPSGKYLACVHSCGSISIWHLPAVRLYKHWSLQEQPDYNVRNPQLSELGDKRNFHGNISDSRSFHPTDINWWSDHAVIIARRTGAVSVCSVGSLRNLLGESPEFLAGPPQVSALCSDHGFLGLECETILTSNKWARDDEHSTLPEVESSDEDEDDDDVSLLNRSTALIQSAIYMVTDMERFQPKRRRPKLCCRTYRLLGLKSTTPEELYARKIDNEEYGEALALAKAYNLDCDLVYQQQWRNSKVSVATIHDYLSKVSKHSWVLRECVERVPETFAAARELLLFGLQGTDIETFITIGEDDAGDEYCSLQHDLNNDGTPAKEKEKIQKAIDILMAKISADELNTEQQDLLQFRCQLLQYFDRLCTYELILGGPHVADELYDYMFYGKFRTIPLITSAVTFARERNWQAVEILFTYHGETILPHWLPVLSNFPETMNPYEYRSLLPECSTDGDVYLWKQSQLRENDWCEKTVLQCSSDDINEKESVFMYQEDESLKHYICSSKTIEMELLTSWYRNRVHQIESQSCMVDYALTLIKLARERNIMGLDQLYNQLLTLDTVVYEVHLEDVRLSDIQKMSDLDTCRLLMSKTTEVTFVDDLKHLILPFLLRCERQTAGSRKQLLHDYLIDLSCQDLSLPLTLFEHLQHEESCPVISSLEEKISVAISCLYAYPNSDQHGKALRILETIPVKGSGSFNALIGSLYEQLEELECDLNAAIILEHNSLSKPLAFIRDCKSNVTTVQQLLIRLARNVAKKIPPPTEIEWSQLLEDMLDLHMKCFSCVNIELCYEIYAATILSSGNKKCIEAAGDILECWQTSWSDKKVSYNQSVRLVLLAAMEYFDSAGSLMDPAMDLAKACLHLITSENEEIKELLDLIDGLQLLNDFGINMLPLQVRLCTDRLRLIESCIGNKPSSYRNTQKLLQLANKLRVCGEDERQREGKVLVLIAQAALEAQDYQFCADICQQLVTKSHAVGWEVVQNLGQCKEYGNLELRHSLISFSLLYCPADVIELLVNTRSLLEVKLLHEKIKLQVNLDTMSDEEEFCDALTSPLSPKRGFPSLVQVVEDSAEVTRHAVYDLLRNVGNKNFWKNTFSWMERNVTSTVVPERIFPFSSQGFPAFYSSLHPDCHFSSFSTEYDKFSEPGITDPVVQLCQSLIRTILLEDASSLGNFTNGAYVLLQLVERLLSEDCCLGLGHLFPIQDLTLTDSVFSNMACTSIALQLATYYYAIQGYKQLPEIPEELKSGRNVYFFSPNELVDHMTRLAMKQNKSTTWAELLLKYQNLLADFQEGQQLQNLGCGVDLKRFTHDKQYQQDSILGLAMTTNKEKFLLSLTLGSRHGASLGEIVARYLTTLLLSSERLHLPEMTTHKSDSNLAEVIKTCPELVCNRLVQFAYPGIAGTDHQLLLSYYTVLESISKDYVTYNLTTEEHIKLLKKVEATSTDIDYKKLVDTSNNVIEVVLPALERNNIGLICELLKSIKSTVQTGELYAAWAQKEFFKIATANVPASTEVWLEQYELCTTHFNKLTAANILSFIKGTCFTEHGIDVMSPECRTAIITKVKEYCQLKIISPLEDEEEEWNDAICTLEHWLAHLDVVSSLEAQKFCESSMQESRNLFRLFDLSMGEVSCIEELVHLAVLSDITLESLKLLFTLLPSSVQTLEICLEQLLKEAITKLRCGNDSDGSQLLAAVLRRMQENLTHSTSSVPQEVEALCGDSCLSPEIRLQALNLLQGLKPNALKSDTTLLCRHTQAIVASAWSQTPISLNESDLSTSESRARLFSRLLGHAYSWHQLMILKDLLDKWPQFEDSEFSSESSENPWIQLIYRMLTFEDRNVRDVETVLDDIFQHVSLSAASIQQLISLAEDSTDLSLLLLTCLLSNHSSLHVTATSLISKYLHADDPVLSNRLLSLLLQRGLTAALTATPAYPQIVEHLLVNSGCDLPPWTTVSDQLVAAGSVAEAGTLHLFHMGVSPALAVFSTSLALSKTTSPEE